MEQKSEIRKQKLRAFREPDSLAMNVLSVVLLGSDESRRRNVVAALAGTQAHVVKESALPQRDGLAPLLDSCDVLIIDVNADVERALELVESACSLVPAITVIVYARFADPELLVRCMRAGARELLTEPLSPNTVADALVRASVRRDEIKRPKRTAGKCLVFIGAKGGSGSTTIASNFAVSLARESGQSVVLLDLDLRLGDAALELGLTAEFSALDALENEGRLDSDLVGRLLVQHQSGLKVLAAPDEHNTFTPTAASVLKLVDILRHDFAWVVIDAGCRYNGYGEALFETAEKVYLVSQVGVPELRNCHRLISALFKDGDAAGKLEVVLNRYAPRAGEIDAESIKKALTVAPSWIVPSDYQAVRAAQNSASALVQKDGPITRVIAQMARASCGKPIEETKKRRFGIW